MGACLCVNYGKRGPGMRMCFSAWYREKAEASIVIGATKLLLTHVHLKGMLIYRHA